MSGQIQESRLDLEYFSTLRLAGTHPAMTATIVVDSITRYEGNAGLTADLARARGVAFTGLVTRGGDLADFRGGDSTVPILRELSDELRRFLPSLPPSGVAEPGIQWVDTTEQRSTSSGVPLTIRAIAEHRVGEPGSRAGEAVLPIQTDARYTFVGTGVQGGQTFEVQGSGQRTTAEFMSVAGRYLGLVTSDSSNFTITLALSGLQITGRQSRADTVSVVP
ncbi:MAG TPA: hypothetical protein VD793_01320 [Gemmatimonadales bacterium]|nr:hypothetical protein [Gemmatimonadales bacterium]